MNVVRPVVWTAPGAAVDAVAWLRDRLSEGNVPFALVFGVLVYRARRRHLMLGANLVRMVLVALVPVLHWLGILDMTVLLALACAIGVASVPFDVSWMSYGSAALMAGVAASPVIALRSIPEPTAETKSRG